jgi:ATP/maltotriose-dependent transcriptional regulator MalT
VPRPRLVEALGEGLARQLILVCAPAGFGKTAVLADWARRGRWPVAWLSLDAGDNDAARFWRHAAAALDRARPGIAERVGPLLGPPASGSFEELCDAVTGRTGSQALLEQVERAGLFLVSLDEVRGWSRYHHLFADLLRARLRQERPGQVVELHRNAAAWCEEHGLPDDAVCTRWPLGR